MDTASVCGDLPPDPYYYCRESPRATVELQAKLSLLWFFEVIASGLLKV